MIECQRAEAVLAFVPPMLGISSQFERVRSRELVRGLCSTNVCSFQPARFPMSWPSSREVGTAIVLLAPGADYGIFLASRARRALPLAKEVGCWRRISASASAPPRSSEAALVRFESRGWAKSLSAVSSRSRFRSRRRFCP